MDLSAHHYGVTVTDIERTADFYQDVLGLQKIAEFTLPGPGIGKAIGIPDATGQFVHLDGESCRVELIEYDPQGKEGEQYQVNQSGAIHIGFEVKDIKTFYEGLPEDIETLSEPETTDSGTQILFLRDPEGNIIEVLET